MSKVIIIGSGPAGISAALYTVRAGIETVVITKGIGALWKAEMIQNFYGFRKEISGTELYENGLEGAKRLGVEFIEEEVVAISISDSLGVETTKSKYNADYVIIATGVSRAYPPVKGLKEYMGRGVSFCAICDSFFYKGKDVCVLGAGEYAEHELNILLKVAATITMLSNGQDTSVNTSDKVVLNNKKIKAFTGSERIEKVVFEDDSEINTQCVFIAYGVAGSMALAQKIGALTEGNRIIVDENMQTNIKGLYAAGDCTGGLLQVAKAVYEGAQAGSHIARSSKKSKY